MADEKTSRRRTAMFFARPTDWSDEGLERFCVWFVQQVVATIEPVDVEGDHGEPAS